MVSGRFFVLTLLLPLALSACGLLHPRPTAPEPAPPALAPFSSGQPGGPIPQGWFAAELRRFKLSTRYELVDDAGVTVVRATAERSSSGLAHNVNLDPREFPILHWRWKVPRPIPGADNTRRDADDSAARVELTFAGPKDRLPLGERAFMAQVKAISGFDMPYATLDYSGAAARRPAASSSTPGRRGSAASSCAAARMAWASG